MLCRRPPDDGPRAQDGSAIRGLARIHRLRQQNVQVAELSAQLPSALAPARRIQPRVGGRTLEDRELRVVVNDELDGGKCASHSRAEPGAGRTQRLFCQQSVEDQIHHLGEPQLAVARAVKVKIQAGRQ